MPWDARRKSPRPLSKKRLIMSSRSKATSITFMRTFPCISKTLIKIIQTFFKPLMVNMAVSKPGGTLQPAILTGSRKKTCGPVLKQSARSPVFGMLMARLPLKMPISYPAFKIMLR